MTTEAPLKRVAVLRVDRRRQDSNGILTLDAVESGTGRLLSDPWAVPAVPPEAGVADVAPGDVLFGKLRPYLAKVVHVTRPAYASTELMCLRPKAEIDSRWFFYRMLAQPTVEWSVATSEGTKMPRTSWERLGEFRVQVPGLHEQQAVADYLDAETVRIDAMLSRRRLQAEAVLSRCRTAINGILDNLEDWVPLKRLLRAERDALIAGPFGSDLAGSDLRPDGVMPVFNQRTVLDAEFQSFDHYVDAQKADELARFRIEPLDVLVTGRGTIGRSVLVPYDAPDGLLHPCLLRVRTDPEKLAPALLQGILQWSDRVRDEFRLQSTATTIDVIYSGTLKEVLVPRLQRSEQDGLIERIASLAARADSAYRVMQRQVAVLHERRQALITAAVTGEIEV
jgi:type I restriction enzyme, S subunit